MSRHAITRDDPPPPPPIDDDLSFAARAFFPDATALANVTGHAHLVRVEAAGRSWLVRRWREGASKPRIAFLQSALIAARSADLAVAPSTATLPERDEETILEHEGSLYDAQSWLPGSPYHRRREPTPERRQVDRSGPLPPGMLAEVAAALGRWHLATAALTTRPDATLAPLDEVVRDAQRALHDQQERLRPVATQLPHVQRWFRVARQVLDTADGWLERAAYLREIRAVVAHTNLWPAHLLFAGDRPPRFVGFVGWSDAAVSSPVLDLAQLVVHFGGWSAGAAEDVLAAYAETAPLLPEERRMLPAVAGVDLAAHTGRLLVAAHAGGRDIRTHEADALQESAASLLFSLEAIQSAVERGDAAPKPRGRTWDYGPRKGAPPSKRAEPKGGKRRPERPAKRPPTDPG